MFSVVIHPVPNSFKTTNTQSAIVWRCRFFWLSSSTWGRFFRCCLTHSTDFSLFRKGHVLRFTGKQKCSSFPNHHRTEWTKLHAFDDNTASIKFKMWVELSSNFCHLGNIIRPLLRTNSLYEKPTVVFSQGVWGVRFTLEDHAYGTSRFLKTTALQSRASQHTSLSFWNAAACGLSQ